MKATSLNRGLVSPAVCKLCLVSATLVIGLTTPAESHSEESATPSAKKILHVDVKMKWKEVNGLMPAGRFIHTREGLAELWANLKQPKDKLPAIDFKTHLIALDHHNAGDDNKEHVNCRVDDKGRMSVFISRTQRGYTPGPFHRVVFYEITREGIVSFNGVIIKTARDVQ